MDPDVYHTTKQLIHYILEFKPKKKKRINQTKKKYTSHFMKVSFFFKYAIKKNLFLHHTSFRDCTFEK